jgi:hypothetical protein
VGILPVDDATRRRASNEMSTMKARELVARDE